MINDPPMQRDLPYKIHIPDRGNLEVVIHGCNRIGVVDRKLMTYLEYKNGKFLMKEVGEHVFDRRIFRIATREDIQRAGIWDLVTNNEDLPKREQKKPSISALEIFENCFAGL